MGAPSEYVHYAGAKAAVDAFTVGLAKELADQGVRVNAVAPGLVRTGIHAAAGDPGRLDRVVGRVPMGRVGEPDEIAPAIAWLLGPESGYVTGTVLRVAGGMWPCRRAAGGSAAAAGRQAAHGGTSRRSGVLNDRPWQGGPHSPRWGACASPCSAWSSAA